MKGLPEKVTLSRELSHHRNLVALERYGLRQKELLGKKASLWCFWILRKEDHFNGLMNFKDFYTQLFKNFFFLPGIELMFCVLRVKDNILRSQLWLSGI